MAIDALTTTRSSDGGEPVDPADRLDLLPRRERRRRWLNRAVDVYVALMFAMLVLSAGGIEIQALLHVCDLIPIDSNGWGDKLLSGVAMVFGHPAILAARLAHLMVGPQPITLGHFKGEAAWERAWNITFNLALAPYIVVLLFVSWRRYRTGWWWQAALYPILVAAAFLWVIQTFWDSEGSMSSFTPFGVGG